MNLFKVVVFILLSGVFSSCIDKLPEIVSNDFCPGLRLDDGTCPYSKSSLNKKAWDFNNPANYTYNKNHIEINSGKVTLKSVDQIHSGADFNKGSHVGTYGDINNGLNLKTKLHDSLNIKNILPDRESNLVGYWRMDGNWDDESGNNFTRSPVNGAAMSSHSKIGTHSGIFDGLNQTSVLNYTPTLNPSQFTFSCWAKVTGGQGTYRGPFTSRGNVTGYQFYASSSDNWQLWAGDGTVYQNLAGDDIVIGEWTHLVGTYDGTTLKFYINGVLVNTLEMTLVPNTTHSSYIASANGNFYFPGQVDEVAVWNTYLSDEEISKLYNTQSEQLSHDTELSSSWAPKWDSIIGHWKMDGNWKDSSKSKNHGSPSGSPVFTNDNKVGNLAGDFNGTNTSLYSSASSQFIASSDQPISIMFWMKPKAISGSTINHRIINLHRGSSVGSTLAIGLGANDKIQYYNFTDTSYVDFDSKAALNNWQHVALIYNGYCFQPYLNGRKDGSCLVKSLTPGGSYPLRIGSFSFSDNHYDGLLDEVIIWNMALNNDEVVSIYNRQKQKFAGHYDSPVIDIGAPQDWTHLKPKTIIPFMKELTTSIESSSQYPQIIGELSDGLVGYWPLDETTYNSALDGADFADKSGNNAHAYESGSVSLGHTLKLKNAIDFDGINDVVTVSNTNAPNPNDTITVSFWMQYIPRTENSWQGLIRKADGGVGWYLQRSYTTGLVQLRLDTSSGLNQTKSSTTEVFDGKPHHVLITADQGRAKLYVDGQLDFTWNYNHGTGFSSTGDILIGSRNNFSGILDEVLIWNRTLDSAEVKQLYRRGANRIKYQVRSCDDPVCDIEAFQGPDGTASTYFSELHNNDIINITTGTPEGATKPGSPEFDFDEFVAPPSNNRYFQYRVIMESDDENNLCNGLPCLPELSSIEIGPTGRYFGASPTIVTNTPITYNKINSITISESGNCSIGYQLSNDGSNYYFWNGSSWIAVGADHDRSSKEDVMNNIKVYSTQFGAGELYLKAYLSSDTSQSCSLQGVTLENVK